VAFPTMVRDTVPSMEAFGSNVQKIMSSSGSPISYVEPPPTSTPSSGSSGVNSDKESGRSHGATCNVALFATSSLLVLLATAGFTL
jgi:hypothetical protein